MSGRRLPPRLATCLTLGTCVSVLGLVAAVPAQAQGPRLEVTASAAHWDGYGLGTVGPSITGPQAPTGSPVLVLNSDVALRSGPGAELRVGWRIWRGLYAEATGGLGRNTVEASIRDDIERAPAVTVSTALTQITVEGGALFEVATVPLPAGRLVGFVSGGGGYLRQVHEDRILIETGTTAYVGGGVKWRGASSRPRGLLRRVVVRGDVRVVARDGGVDIEDARRTYITVSAGVGLRLF